MPRTFTARYDGRCRHCSEQICEGDEVGYVDDELACTDCFYDEHPESL